MSIIAGVFSVPPGHPSLPGHFPGRPLVPGVLLLDEALALIAPYLASTMAGVSRVKFLRPVLPGEAVVVTVDPATGAFGCAVAGHPVVSGQVSRQPGPAP